jgi:hypothetical protein
MIGNSAGDDFTARRGCRRDSPRYLPRANEQIVSPARRATQLICAFVRFVQQAAVTPASIGLNPPAPKTHFTNPFNPITASSPPCQNISVSFYQKL